MAKLDFSLLDDIALATQRRGADPRTELRGIEIDKLGPLVELLLHIHAWHLRPSSIEVFMRLPRSQCVLKAYAQNAPALAALRNNSCGALRLASAPSTDDTLFDQFGLAAQKAAVTAGAPVQVARSLVGAMKELRDNVFEHSRNAETGLLAFASAPGHFEFCVADNGIGVLRSLQEHSDYSHLSNNGEAMKVALKDGESRHGRNSGRGFGFVELFRGISKIKARARFRSGNHALEIFEDSNKMPLFECSDLSGFLISVECTGFLQTRK